MLLIIWKPQHNIGDYFEILASGETDVNCRMKKTVEARPKAQYLSANVGSEIICYF